MIKIFPFRSVSIALAAGIGMLLPWNPALASAPASAPAPAPAVRSDPYIATHYGPDEGLYADVVDKIQRTPDGFLWLIVNGKGLARFDGRHFDLLVAHGITALAVSPRGDLWIGTTDGLKRMPLRALPFFDLADADSFSPGPAPAGHVISLRSDGDGTLWVGTESGLYRFRDGQFTPVGPRVSVREIERTAAGHLLLITGNGFVELDPTNVVPVPDLTNRLGTRLDEVFHVMEDRHGDTWYCTARGVVRRGADGWRKLLASGSAGTGAYHAYEDGRGVVWISRPDGLLRATATGLEPAFPKMQVRTLYDAGDGTLWIGTNGGGLVRLKERKARVFTTADGLPNDVIMCVIAARDSSIWAGVNCGGLIHYERGRFRTYTERDGLQNSCVWALAEDAKGDLWIGTWGGGVFRLHDGRFTQFLSGEAVTSVVAARDGSIWCSTRNGVARLRQAGARMYTTADGLPTNTSHNVYEDRAGRILVGSGGGVSVLVGDRFESFPAAPKLSAEVVGEDRSGALFIGLPSETYALRIQGQRTDTVPDFSQPEGLVETNTGDQWFTGVKLHRVPPNRLARVPLRAPLDDEIFGPGDGLVAATSGSGHPTLALGADGTVWVATPRGLAAFDPRQVTRTDAPATLYVRDVTIDGTAGPAPRELLLPPGTSHIEIDFAAVETNSPEKIRMQYRLDGVDRRWLDVGPDLRATYSNIPVGKHALRLRASNRNGIWDRDGVAYYVTQRPYFYQTGWFLGLAILGGLAMVILAHRLRVGQVTRQLNTRFDERLAERTRVARDLHDTFLQTVQGSKLVAEDALRHPEDPARVKRAMEQLVGWLSQATEEARAALNSLRATTIERNDLAMAFGDAVQECRALDHQLDGKVSTTGGPRDLHPIVRDEIYRIGYEAIRNACAHSDAQVLRVVLEHAHDLTLRIIDDGVGVDSALAEKGKAGHFGLKGMRERAERIGAKLTISSSPGLGTTITLIVPGRVAYQSQAIKARRS